MFLDDFKKWQVFALEIDHIHPNYLRNYQELKKKAQAIERHRFEILNHYQIHLLPNRIDRPKIGRALLQVHKKVLSSLNLRYKEGNRCTQGYALQIEGQTVEEEQSSMMGKKKLSLNDAKLNLIQCPNTTLHSVDLPELFAFEVMSKSLEDHLVDRIENLIFNEKNNNHQIDVLKLKIKELLKDVIPL
jgi:hypothetical protein